MTLKVRNRGLYEIMIVTNMKNAFELKECFIKQKKKFELKLII